ncbi:MAG: Tetratricopeptide repeat protein [Candidatus Latescibacteria bacterium ADurb.Bin168]|nr:MAG: Tetratricopeptide repeat protein [Candidatus Latescibacteria bacterium ADurb.Bin168]
MKRMFYAAAMIACSGVLGSPARVHAQGTVVKPELTAEQALALNAVRDSARTLFQQRKYRDAVEAYKRSLLIDSTDAATYFNLGLGYQVLGNDDEALAMLNRSVALDSLFAPAHLEVGKVYLKKQELEQAEEAYLATKRIFADSLQYSMAADQGLNNVAIAYSNRAVLGMRERNFGSAEADAEKAISLSPDISRGYVVAATVYENQQKYDEAEQRYRAAVDRAENDQVKANALEGIARSILGRVRDSRNNTSGVRSARLSAAEILRQAARIDTTNFTALVNLGNTLFDLEQYAAAESALVRAESLRPRDFRPPLKLAETYMKLNRCGEAEQAATRALAVQPGNASAHATRAEALECLGRTREALDAYVQASRDPRWKQYADRKAKTLREQLGLPAQN